MSGCVWDVASVEGIGKLLLMRFPEVWRGQLVLDTGIRVYKCGWNYRCRSYRQESPHL